MEIYRKVKFDERRPSDDGWYDTDKGELYSGNMDNNSVTWWLESIEIPSDDHLGEMAHSEAWKRDMGLSENNSYETGYWEGANFILNHLK